MDEMSVKNVMYDEAKAEYEEAGKMTLGSEEHTKTVQAANSIADRLNKMAELDNEARKLDLEEERLKVEKERNEKEAKHQKRNLAVTVAMGVLYAGVQIFGYVDSKRFEKDGFSHTTDSGRTSTRGIMNLMDRLRK